MQRSPNGGSFFFGMHLRRNVEFIVESRKSGTLKYWVTYLRIHKFANTSGYISKFNTRKCCDGKYSTFMSHVNKMIEMGWMRRIKNGYRLVSYKKFTGMRAIRIYGKSVKELVARAARCAWDYSVTKQICKVFKNDPDSKKKRLILKKSNGIDVSEYSVSVRWFMNLMGYASATSGSRVEKLMEEFELVSIKRQSEFLFDVCDQEAWAVFRKTPDTGPRIFLKGFHVYRRKINLLTPLL